jgi:hypothetical protein
MRIEIQVPKNKVVKIQVLQRYLTIFFHFFQKSQIQNILTFFHFLYHINHFLLLLK